jgi:hypothetical protein
MVTRLTVFHVAPAVNGALWVVSRQNDDSVRAEYRTKDQAIRAAAALARGEKPSRVRVFGGDGSMEHEHTYDPTPNERF